MKTNLIALASVTLSLFAGQPVAAGEGPVGGPAAVGRFSHATLDTLLRSVVHDDLVDYAAVRQQRSRLERYLGQIAGATAGQLPTRADSLAFFINAYNALVLSFVTDRDPEIRSVLDEPEGKGEYPGFFKEKGLVAGRPVSLDDLEHKVLRGRFHEPRIHFAINCASISCPPLRAGAFQAKGLEEQLEEVTRRFINDPTRNRFDPETGRLYLSQIFQWFPMDFERAAGSVEAFFFAYLDGHPAHRDIPGTEILFLPYDWRLNAWRR